MRYKRAVGASKRAHHNNNVGSEEQGVAMAATVGHPATTGRFGSFHLYKDFNNSVTIDAQKTI